MLKIFGPLKEYIESNPSKRVNKTLENFFADPLSKFYLIEGNQTSGYEAVKIVDSMYNALETIVAVEFLSVDAEREVQRITRLDPNFDETSVFDIIRQIYGKKLLNKTFINLPKTTFKWLLFRELFGVFG